MSRSYKNVKPKIHRVYSVDDVLSLYGICRNTLSNWERSGLRSTGGKGPRLYRGAELKRFHDARKLRVKGKLKFGEFKCLGCDAAVFPELETVHFSTPKTGCEVAQASCPDCGALVVKFLGATERDSLKNCLDTNTGLGKPDEERGAILAGIGKIEGEAAPKTPSGEFFGLNDRIIYAWQIYAGRHSEKTVEAYLTNIRVFEEALGGMPFERLTQPDVASYRDSLIALGKASPDEGGLSKATIRKRASQLRKFLNWLRQQDGFRKLSANIADYLELPKAMEARQLVRLKRAFPTIEEAVEMVLLMPSGVGVERRQRAMVACAFITGFRAGALTTLRLKHMNIEAKEAVQDASEMRAKNGKSYRANWFPRTEEMHEILIDWVAELRNLGFSEEDALFPDHRDLHAHEAGHSPVQPMKSEGAIAAAFAVASKTIGKAYCPHSARHCLAALGDRLFLSKEQEKAWSLNLGHEKVATTEAHYGKMTDENRKAVMLGLHTGGAWADDEKELMLDFYQYRLTPGTTKFRRAKELIKKREAAEESFAVIE